MERLPDEGVLYSVDQDKLEATVTGYSGDKNVIIPSTVRRSHGYEYTGGISDQVLFITSKSSRYNFQLP